MKLQKPINLDESISGPAIQEGSRTLQLRHFACASAVAVGMGISALTMGVGWANAQPGGPPCNSQQQQSCPNQNSGGNRGAPPRAQDNRGEPPQDNRGGTPRAQDDRGGAPPAQEIRHEGPPRQGDFGWNNGSPPGGRPDGFNGPTPPGGWDGPPPEGGWNDHWYGPPRDIDQARFDHQPFNYYGYNAVPVFEPDQGGFGFWFFGLWIPL